MKLSVVMHPYHLPCRLLRLREVLNKKKQKELCDSLNSVDHAILIDVAHGKLAEQLSSNNLREFTDKLFKNDQLL